MLATAFPRRSLSRGRRPVQAVGMGGSVVLVMLLVWGVPGCSKSHTRFKHPRFMTEADCAACVEVALDAESPDARREAVVHLAKTPYLTDDVVVRALAAIARTDPSESVRYAAVRGLAKAAVPQAGEPLLELVKAPQEPETELKIRSGNVRWAALEGLDALIAQGQLTDEPRQACQTAAIHWLDHDRAHDVRIAAARLLRHFPSRETLTALIDALEQRDFGVAYHSERSLMHLTGQTFEHNAAVWRQWLAITDDPFAGAGQLDHEIYPKAPNWWMRTVTATREVLAGFKPGQNNDQGTPIRRPEKAMGSPDEGT